MVRWRGGMEAWVEWRGRGVESEDGENRGRGGLQGGCRERRHNIGRDGAGRERRWEGER